MSGRRKQPRRPAPPALVAELAKFRRRITTSRKRSPDGKMTWTPDARQTLLDLKARARKAGMRHGDFERAVGMNAGQWAHWPEYYLSRRSADAPSAPDDVETAADAPSGVARLTTPDGFTLTVGSVRELAELLRLLRSR